MAKANVKRHIREMVRRLVREFDPDRIILFGSHARGDAGPDSDVDLLVILPFTGSKFDKMLQMRGVLHSIPVPLDVFAVTPEEVERRRNIVGTLVYPAIHEGKVLYERRSQRTA